MAPNAGQEPLIRGVAHVMFRVADLDRALRFYCDTLGMEKAFPFVRENGEHYGQYIHVGGRTFIELFKADLAAPAEGQSYGHICLEVDDIEKVVRELRERGVEVSDPKLGTDRSWQAWVTDPDGNRIELHHYTPESKQAPYLR